MRRIIGKLAVALAISIVPASSVGALDAQAGESDEPEFDVGAIVKIEVRTEKGEIVKHKGEIRSLGMDWNIEFEGADHRHHMLVHVVDAKKGNFKVRLGYDRDGQAIIAPFEDSYKAKKRQVLRTDGGIALALTFQTKKFPRPKKQRDDGIEPDEGDDPLGENPLR